MNCMDSLRKNERLLKVRMRKAHKFVDRGRSRRVDELVYELYGLTPEEIEIVEVRERWTPLTPNKQR